MRLKFGDVFEIEFQLPELGQIVKEVKNELSPSEIRKCVCGHTGYMHEGRDQVKGSPPSGKCRYHTCSCEEFRAVDL